MCSTIDDCQSYQASLFRTPFTISSDSWTIQTTRLVAQLHLASASRERKIQYELGMTGEGSTSSGHSPPSFLRSNNFYFEFLGGQNFSSRLSFVGVCAPAYTSTLPPHLRHLLCLWSRVPLGYLIYFPCPMRIIHTPSEFNQFPATLFV